MPVPDADKSGDANHDYDHSAASSDGDSSSNAAATDDGDVPHGFHPGVASASCLKATKPPTPARMLSCLLNTAKALVLTILSVLRKVLCFWRREKSTGGFSEIDRSHFPASRSAATGGGGNDLTSWDSWDDGQPSEIVIGSKEPETVDDHIRVSIRTS